MVGQQTTEGAWPKIRRIFLSSNLLSRRNRNNVLAMGIIGFGYTFFEEIVTTYMQFYYTEFMLLPAAVVASVLSISIIIDGVTDFLMGMVIDHLQTKKGRLRQWFLWMAIPTALATVGVFFCQDSWSVTAKTVYLFVIYNIYCTCMTTIRMPKTTMISMCFNDPDARQQANVVSGVLGQFSQLLITAGLPLLLAVLGSTASAYTNSSIILSAGGILLTMFTYALTREVVGSRAAVQTVRETEGDEAADIMEKILAAEGETTSGKAKDNTKKRNVFKDIGMLVANKYWLINMGTSLANGVGIGFMFGVATYFAQYTLGGVQMLAGVFGTLSIGMMVGIFFAAPVIIKLDSRMVGVIGSFVGALGMAIAAVGILGFNSLAMFHVGLFVRQLGTGFIIAINGDMTARVIDYGEWRFGYRIDGLAFSGSAVMSKIMSAAATAILGFTLTAVGYQGGMAELPATALSAINNMFLWVPCVALVVSGIFYIMLNLSNKRVAEMRAEIAARALKKPENTEI